MWGHVRPSPCRSTPKHGYRYCENYDPYHRYSFKKDTLFTDLPQINSFHRPWLKRDPKHWSVLRHFTFSPRSFAFSVFFIMIISTKMTKVCRIVANKLDFHAFGMYILNADLFSAEKYTLFPEIEWNCYPKRGPRGPRQCLKKVPFPAFFWSDMTSHV